MVKNTAALLFTSVILLLVSNWFTSCFSIFCCIFKIY